MTQFIVLELDCSASMLDCIGLDLLDFYCAALKRSHLIVNSNLMLKETVFYVFLFLFS